MTDAPSHEEVVQSLIRDANTKLVEKINQSHAQAEIFASETVDSIIRSINKAREAGLYLIELQEQTPHGAWAPLFRCKQYPAAPILFNDVTASRWMRLAKALPDALTRGTLPDGVRHLTDMLRIVHALPESSGHGEQTRHEERSPFQSLTKFTGELQACLSDWRRNKPVSEWEPHLRDQVKSQLEPLVQFYQSL